MKKGTIQFTPNNSLEDAVNDSQKPGAKAGNEFVDKIWTKDKINKILIDEDMPRIRFEIDLIINSGRNNVKKIECILDTLLDYAPVGKGKEEFKKLNEYYFTKSPLNSKNYDEFYREMD